ncbi:c-5 sterol desaturase [Tulasnella sp. 424]|nr:c-5 sterol desaturase [Tulasnella sp. 424]KAG8981261.1 c-5 sterol desaturase [Tulasnella sp. 425]
MDLILSVADSLVFDTVWAKLVPLTAFVDAPSIPTSSPQAVLSTAPSAWTDLLRSLPHPPIPAEIASGALNSTVSSLSAWPRDYVPRQLISVTILTIIGIHVLYFLFAGLSYYFIFNHEMMKHPKFLKNQVRQEIQSSLRAFPGMIALTLPCFMAEVRGYSQLYDDVGKYGWTYLVLSVPLYLLFTDYFIYWIHRLLHHPLIYKHVHKPHHKWLIPTPFASHAFHYLDGYLQSVPYHVFIFIFPLQRALHLVLFVAVNFWAIFIHDSEMITGGFWENIINGPSHHTLHHLFFTCNYGQYFTWADRVGGSYKHPMPELDPFLEVLQAAKKAGKIE